MATQVALKVATRDRRPAGSAGIPIVAAKITAPGMPDWVLRRARITKVIAEGRRWYPLTLVTAPAGSGKTMALSVWAAAEPGTVAWVTVDRFDNRGLLDLRRRGAAPVRRRRPGGVAIRAGAGHRARLLAAARGGTGRPGPAGDAGPG